MTPLRFLIARTLRDEPTLASLSISREALLAHLKHQTVALVGNARALSQTTFGAAIDAHDLVIRINRAPGTGAASHGTRTDWLALATSLDAATYARLAPTMTLWMSHKRKRLPYRVTHHPFYLHPQPAIRALWDRLADQPTTGLMLIDLLAQSEATRIDLYGFDFFASLSLSGHRSAAQVPHDFASEKAFVDAILVADPRFTLHPMPKGDSPAPNAA